MQQNRAMKIFRIVLMGVLVILLVCVVAPVGYLISPSKFEDAIGLDFPAWCLYHPSLDWKYVKNGVDIIGGKSGYNGIYGVFTLLIILYGDLSRVWLLFPDMQLSNILNISPGQPWLYIETKLERLQHIQASTKHGATKAAALVGYKLTYSLLVFLAAGKQLYGSKTWEVITQIPLLIIYKNNH